MPEDFKQGEELRKAIALKAIGYTWAEVFEMCDMDFAAEGCCQYIIQEARFILLHLNQSAGLPVPPGALQPTRDAGPDPGY